MYHNDFTNKKPTIYNVWWSKIKTLSSQDKAPESLGFLGGELETLALFSVIVEFIYFFNKNKN